jgi:hypothetical protein
MVSEDTCRGAFDGVFSEQVSELGVCLVQHGGFVHFVKQGVMALCITAAAIVISLYVSI